jgi:hypothetical protein
VPLEPGVVINSILSVSDIVPGSGNPPDRPDYQMTGIPDGLGAYGVRAPGRAGTTTPPRLDMHRCPSIH